MAVLGKTIRYVNSSGVALMRWVKTLQHKRKKELIKNVNFINCCFVKFCGKGHSDIKQQLSKSKENNYIKLKPAASREFSKTVRKNLKISILRLCTHSEKIKEKNPVSRIENTCYHVNLKPCKT